MDKPSHKAFVFGEDAFRDPDQDAPEFEQLQGGYGDPLAGVRNLATQDSNMPADFVIDDPWETHPNSGDAEDRTSTIDRNTVLAAIGIFLLAAAPRLISLFLVSDPTNPGLGWYNDTFHHWQIGYLSGEIGFSKGFLTLWDFRGMEYFWGLLHPLLLALIFKASGSVDIVIPRLLSTFASSAAIALLFILLRRYFNLHVALAATLLAIVNPVAIFGDSAGMQEPIGLALIFLGFVLWPRHPVWAGVLIGIAGMARAEYWVLGGGLVVASWITRATIDRKFMLTIGWAIPSFLYMRYMAAKTGNAIYPIYWNYIGSVAGEWMTDRPPTSDEVLVQWIARLVFVIALAGLLWLVRNRPRSTPFLGFGLANILLLGFMWGFSDYVIGFEPRILIGRLVILPYIYLGIFAAVLLLYVIPKRIGGKLSTSAGWIVIVIMMGALQLVWSPLLDYYTERAELWTIEKTIAHDIAEVYESGTIIIPDTRPGLTYALVRYEGIPAQAMQSSMYDPFAYMSDADPFENWDSNRPQIASWIQSLDIQLLVFHPRKMNYQEMVSLEPEWFSRLDPGADGKMEIYEVISQ